jgi:hypothetical protein
VNDKEFLAKNLTPKKKEAPKVVIDAPEPVKLTKKKFYFLFDESSS